MKRAVYTLLPAMILAGCALPQWRVFQAKIDPKLADKPAAQIESERAAAEFIQQRSAPAPASPAEDRRKLDQIHSVAADLSASLGEPARPVQAGQDYERIIAELRRGQIEEQRRAEQWRTFAKKYAGKPIEDTGINLAGPAGLMALLGIVAACIFIPGFGWVLMRLLPVLWAGLRRAAGAVESLAAEAPEAVAKIKAALPQREDAVRRVLRKAKPVPSS